MKKIIGLTIAVVLVIGLIAGGTFAYFSDTERSTDNTFTAGIIDIELSHLDGEEGAFIDIDDIKPCQVKYGFFDIHGKEGTNPGPVFIHITGVTTGQGTQSDAEEEAEGDNPVHNIDDWMTVSLIVVTERPPGEPTSEEMAAWLANPDNVDKVIIHHDDHMKLGDLESAIIPVGYIEGFSTRIWLVMDLHLQAETDNRYQGDTCSFTVEAIMTQEGAPPPIAAGNKIILENKDTSTWEPILGDGIWGWCKYDVSSLDLEVYAQGLNATTDYQIALNSPEQATWFPVSGGETMRRAMASALASGVYDGTNPGTAPPAGFNLFERGYYDPDVSSNLIAGPPAWDGDENGVYAFTNHGLGTTAATTDGDGKFDVNKSAILPSGDYEYIKVCVKIDTSPWTVILMEKDVQLFFTIP